jgi:hypothetical protein
MLFVLLVVSTKLYALNVEFSWSAGDFIFGGDVIKKNMQIEFNVLKFNWFDTKTGIGINTMPYQFVFGVTSKNNTQKPKNFVQEDEIENEKYNATSWGSGANFSFHGFSFFPVEIVYSPFNIMEVGYLFFYGRMAWRFWQDSYEEFVTHPFSFSNNGFYGAAGIRIAGVFPVSEKTPYAVTIGAFMEYTTKNELKIGITADLIGSIFGMAHALSSDYQKQHEKDNPLFSMDIIATGLNRDLQNSEDW